MSEDTLCGCGKPLHYSSIIARREVEDMVERFGVDVTVTTAAGSWRVPRHYIALHGLKEPDVPDLAALYGWARA